MDEPGGFSSAELMRLLSPSCENLDSLLPHSDAWLPRVAPRTPRRTADCSFVRHLDDVELCHACPMRIGGGRLGVLVTDSSALVLAECRVRSRDESDVLTLSSKATKVPRRIQKVRELCEWRALVAYDAQVGVVGVGGGDDDAPCSLHLLQEPTWSADDALVATGVFPDDTAPRLACASARGTLTLIDAATMKPVARTEHSFGALAVSEVSWSAWRRDLVGVSLRTATSSASTSTSPSHASQSSSSTRTSFVAFDARAPLTHAAKYACEGLQTHAFVGDVGVLLALNDGHLRLLDARKTDEPLLAFRDPRGGDVLSLSASPDGMGLVQATGAQGVVLWDVGLHSTQGVCSATHDLRAQILLQNPNAQINSTSWLSPTTLAVADDHGHMGIYDLRGL